MKAGRFARLCAAWLVALATSTVADADFFSPAGRMMQPRTVHTATLLLDGRVLLVGGLPQIPSAEVYDPVTLRFLVVANPALPRYAHAAVRLPGGEVWIGGGTDGRGASHVSCEIYDSRTDTWRAAAPMPGQRPLMAAVLLADGRVLVLGGGRADTALYDPATNAWSPGGTMAQARIAPSVALLADGRVLAAAGTPYGGPSIKSTELYDPATNAWAPAGPLNETREGQPAVLHDGRVLLAGPGSQLGLGTAEVFDPRTGRWSSVARMHGNWGAGLQRTTLATGRVLVLGGTTDGGTRLSADTEVYDPIGDEWARGARMATPRHGSAVTLLADGRALVTGGMAGFAGPVLDQAEIYTPDAPTIPVASTPLAVVLLSLAVAAIARRRRD